MKPIISPEVLAKNLFTYEECGCVNVGVLENHPDICVYENCTMTDGTFYEQITFDYSDMNYYLETKDGEDLGKFNMFKWFEANSQ